MKKILKKRKSLKRKRDVEQLESEQEWENPASISEVEPANDSEVRSYIVHVVGVKKCMLMKRTT